MGKLTKEEIILLFMKTSLNKEKNILIKKLNKEETILSYLAGNFLVDAKNGKIAATKQILKLVCETFQDTEIYNYAWFVYGPCKMIEMELKRRNSSLLEDYEVYACMGGACMGAWRT